MHALHNVLRARSLPLWALAFALLMQASTGVAVAHPAQAAAHSVTGVVFEDFNGNGTRDAGGTLGSAGLPAATDRGIGGVAITAYDSAGALAGSTTSVAPDGAYTLTLAAAGPFRIEFSSLPAGYQPAPHGANNGTSVQFVPAGAAARVDFGIVLPANYCQNNPDLAVNCFHFGDPMNGANADKPALYRFSYSAGSDDNTISHYDAPLPASVLTARTIGATFGLAYARGARRLFAAAYFKKHAGFGPGGPGAIYRIDPATGTVDATFTVPGAVTNAHDAANYTTGHFNAGWDAVGKTSLGGIALSPDETRLFVMNLESRALVALNTATGDVVASAPVPVDTVPLPNGMCASSDVRPFAVEVHAGQGYLGLVCTAESTQITAGLRAYVYSFDVSTLAIGAAPVFQAALDYPRGFGNDDPNPTLNPPGTKESAQWNAWRATYAAWPAPFTSGTWRTPVYPQPMLATLAFDADGNLMLGLRDRFGDQTGNEVYSNPDLPAELISGVPAGDVLKACGNPAAGWALESDARCAGGGSGPQGNGQGPGGGEFFFADEYLPHHQETSLGSLTHVPGFPEVVVASLNPIPILDDNTIFDGGLRWLNLTAGSLSRAYRIYDGHRAQGNVFGKAAGIGDVTALCDEAPIELGNRVWLDANDNGQQDAGEAGIGNVTVNLLDGTGALLNSTTTAPDGSYFFTATHAAGEARILPRTAYRLQVSLAQPALAGLSPSLANSAGDAGNDAIADVRDSDATTYGGAAEVAFTTGGAGVTNHSFDFGFVQGVQGALAEIGNRVWLDANKNGLQDEGEPGMGNVTVNLRAAGGAAPLSSTQTAPDGVYLFSGLQPGEYALEFVKPPVYGWTQRNAGDPAADSDADPATGSAAPTTLIGGESDLTWDAGLVCEANGILRGGVSAGGLAGIPVLLIPIDAPGAQAKLQPTAPDGAYGFQNVIPGRYTVQVHDAFLNQRGFVPVAGGVKIVEVTIAGCQDHIVNFAYEKSSRGALGDFVWYDINANALQDEWFDANGDGAVTQNILNADSVVPLSDYEWWDINGDNRYAGPENEGELRKCGLAVSSTDLLTLFNASDLNNAAAGQPTGIFGYYLFRDLELRDWAVRFKSSDVSLVDAARAMFGTAKCTPLPGAPPALDVPSVPSAPRMQGASVDAPPVTCGISTQINDQRALTEAAPVYLNADFGILCADDLAALGDRVWLDENRNGLQEGRETGIAGVIVRLHNSAGNVISTTTTDPQGAYLFSGLVPGAYAVSFSPRVGYVCTQALAGDDRAIDSDADCNTLRTAPMLLRAGETHRALDAGFYVLNPTGVHLAEFKATLTPAGVQVEWRTSMERDTFGFYVVRSMDGRRERSTRVNAELLPAQGTEGGARYSLIDKAGAVSATYWLEEVELSGNVVDYEPVQVAADAVANPPALPTPLPEWVKGAIPGGIPVPVAAAPANPVPNAPAALPQAPAAGPAILPPQPAVLLPPAAQARAEAPVGNVVATEAVAATPMPPMDPPAPAVPAPAQVAAQPAPASGPAAEVRVGAAQGAANAVEVPRSGETAPARYTPPAPGFLSMPSQAWLFFAMGLMSALCIAGAVGIYLRKWRRLGQ
jgi:hypothetical protein